MTRAPAELSGWSQGGAVLAPDELSQVIEAYNQVTERLRDSHVKLQAEVARLREELASADAQLQRSRRLAALGEMAAGISHEVRNPLAAIQLYAQMILEDLTAPEPACESAAEATRKIASAVRGLDAIVNDVLAFARSVDVERREVGLDAVFARVIEANAHGIEAADVEIEVSGGAQVVDADPQLLEQALINLVRNAVDAVAGRPERRVVLAAESDAEGWRVTVRDTGPGIDREAEDRIFNPFFTTRATGTGLGLAIVHRIVDAHNGTISVHNDPGTGGAVFRVRLPKPRIAGAAA